MDRGARQATVHGVTKSWTWLSDWAHTHTNWHMEVKKVKMKVAQSHQTYGSEKSENENCSVTSDSLWPHGLYTYMQSFRPEYWSGKPFPSPGIFPNQGSNPGLPHGRQILYQLSHKGSPRVLEWVAYPFSSGSSQPRNRTSVSCIAGGFFTNWVSTREASTNQIAVCKQKYFLNCLILCRLGMETKGI